MSYSGPLEMSLEALGPLLTSNAIQNLRTVNGCKNHRQTSLLNVNVFFDLQRAGYAR